MASLPIMFARPTVRVQATKGTTAKGTTKGTAGSGGKEEKGLLDFILGALTKQDQFYETDPILQKAEGKSGGGTTSSGTRNKNTVAVPQKKKEGGGGFGGFGGLFAKK